VWIGEPPYHAEGARQGHASSDSTVTWRVLATRGTADTEFLLAVGLAGSQRFGEAFAATT
jgi:hypothetical protein